jgi:hypothetical protein
VRYWLPAAAMAIAAAGNQIRIENQTLQLQFWIMKN